MTTETNIDKEHVERAWNDYHQADEEIADERKRELRLLNYELRRVPWESREAYRVSSRAESVGKIELRDMAWVAINHGDMLFPTDDARFATPGEAAKELVQNYATMCGWCGRLRNSVPACSCRTTMTDDVCAECGTQLTERERISYQGELCFRCGEIEDTERWER
jgi:hypothetical protein